jgi:DNA-binding NtrC family response regulator
MEIRRTVSREHARLVFDGRDYWIEDLGSNNFTYLNRQIVLAATRLSFPCTLRLGTCVLELRLESRSSLDVSGPRSERHISNHSPTVDTLTLGLSINLQSGLRDHLQWASVLLEIAGIAAYGRRADEVQERVKECLARCLGVVSTDLHLRVGPNQLLGALEKLGLGTQDAKQVAEQLAGIGPYAPVLKTTAPGAKCVVWAVLRPEALDQTFALVLARRDGKTSDRAGSDEIDTVVAVSVRLAAPIIEALEENQNLRAAVKDSVPREPSDAAWTASVKANMWGGSPAFRYCLYCTEQAAMRYLPMDQGDGRLSTLFVLGESGTGKSALCKLIHSLSDRARKPFYELNCAAIPATLAESELFGHVRGAFSEAHKDKPGFFETANGGTLFLDEIGKTSTDFQSKLLKVLDSGEFRRLGSTDLGHTTCHVILAAAEDPEKLIQNGSLLAELWYRTGAFTITMPPLRERPGDIKLIVDAQLARLNENLPRSERKVLSPQALALLMAHPWPGNVRELLGCLRASHALTPANVNTIDVEHLPETFFRGLGAAGPGSRARVGGLNTNVTLDDAVQRLEREYYAALIGECEGNLSEVARRAGKAYQTVHSKLKAFREWLNTATDPTVEIERSRLRMLAGEHWHVIERPSAE